MTNAYEGFFDRALDHLALILGIVEISLVSDKRLRLEDTLRIREETLKLISLIREERARRNQLSDGKSAENKGP